MCGAAALARSLQLAARRGLDKSRRLDGCRLEARASTEKQSAKKYISALIAARRGGYVLRDISHAREMRLNCLMGRARGLAGRIRP